MKAICSNAA